MLVLLSPIIWIGKVIVQGIASVGEIICLLLSTLKQLPHVHKNPDLIVKQMISIRSELPAILQSLTSKVMRLFTRNIA